MGVIEHTSEPKTVKAEYDFAIDGGAIGTLTLRGISGQGNTVPADSVILGGYLYVITPPTSGGAGTGAIGIEGAADVVAAAAVSGAPWSTGGNKSVIPVFTGATSIRTTVARSLTLAIASAALTAGKFHVTLVYV